MKKHYPRNMIGYGSKTPNIKWPNDAKLALQLVLNYEEGSENCVLHGDKTSETFLSEIIGAQPIKGRHINMESFYEYGSRRGFWRIHELFQEKKIPITIWKLEISLEISAPLSSNLGLRLIRRGAYWIFSSTKRRIIYENNSLPFTHLHFSSLATVEFRRGFGRPTKGKAKAWHRASCWENRTRHQSANGEPGKKHRADNLFPVA